VRILKISDVYFPRVNGVSTSIQTFRRELLSQGHEVTLIAPDYGQRTEDEAGVQRIPSRYVFVDPEDRMLKYGHILGLTDELRPRAFDLIHVHTPFVAHYAGLKLGRRLGIPVVETYHTFFEEYLYNYVPWLPRGWLRFAARRFSAMQCNAVDAVVVPSQSMQEVLRRYGVNDTPAVVPTGIALDQFSHGDGATFRARHGIPADRPTLVHVGRIAYEKNIDFLIRVVAEVRRAVPDVMLVVAGEGPALKRLHRYVEELGLAEHVRFVGYLSRSGPLEDCYSAGDAFIFASRTETQGLVLLEAMALGVPVVSTAVMGTRNVLRDGRGALVAKEDPADFGAKVIRILRDRPLRERLADQARAYARCWSAPVLAERMLDVYAEAVERHARVGAVADLPCD
jgi:1,2-diacylglycerol 3-alpha-glucosyltransferase